MVRGLWSGAAVCVEHCRFCAAVGSCLAAENQKQSGQKRRHELGEDGREPYACKPQKQRQEQHRDDFKEQRSQDGNERRHETVVDGREEGRAENGDAMKRKQKE